MARAQEELGLDAGALLDSLFDQAGFGLALLDADVRIVRVNETMARINGQNAPQAVLDACARVLETGEPVTGVRVDAADGSGAFDCSCHPVKQAGSVVGVWASATEVTRERQAREAADRAIGDLAFERGILREVIARAPDPMAVMLTDDLVFAYVNERAMELLPDGDLIGRRADEVFPEGSELAEDLRAAVLEQGETLAVRDVQLGDRFWTFSCVPLGDEGERAGGVLAVGQETTDEVTRRRELEAELAEEHRIATQLQVSLMPDRLPDIPGMDVASGFRPAGEGHEIGGDFYDMFECAENCWMVVIGDVCGKGAEAAALTALTRYTLRAAAIQEGAEPAELMTQLNEAILRQHHDMRFVSGVCAFLDLDPDGKRSVTARVCVAGHLPPLLVDEGGEVTPVEGGAGPVLGIWEEVELREEVVALEAGQRLVLYTDGVLDAQRAAELTEVGLASLLGAHPAGTAAETVSHIERSVASPTGEHPRDDIAVVVLRPVA